MGKISMKLREYVMREIEEEDLPPLLEWRNSPEIHSKMLTNHMITWKEHLAWFQKIKEQKPVLNFAFDYLGKLVGYQGCTYDREQRICSPGSYFAPGLSLPVDAGTCMGDMFYDYAVQTLGVKRMIIEVFTDNSRVVRMNKLRGYQCVGTSYIMKNGEQKELQILSLDMEDWRRFS